jgi:hypothetical protein
MKAHTALCNLTITISFLRCSHTECIFFRKNFRKRKKRKNLVPKKKN